MDHEGLRRIWVKAHYDHLTVEELDSHVFGDFFTFDDRDSYLEWVAKWKSEYAAFSKIIRESRATCKNMQRAEDEKASDVQSSLVTRSRIARTMIALRKAAKKHSWALREEAKFVSV